MTPEFAGRNMYFGVSSSEYRTGIAVTIYTTLRENAML